MKRLKQRDKRWKDVLIGDSESSVGAQGCLITSLCMIFSKFHPFNDLLNPGRMAKAWDFTVNLLSWDTKFWGMEFVERVWNYNRDQDEEIKKLCKSPLYGVALQVQTRGGGVHWVACVGKSVLGWATNDPWTGRRLWKTVGFGAPYIRILGWVKFRKKEL